MKVRQIYSASDLPFTSQLHSQQGGTMMLYSRRLLYANTFFVGVWTNHIIAMIQETKSAFGQKKM